MDGFKKKIVISTTPINDILSKNSSNQNIDTNDKHIPVKKHSDISNTILAGLLHSFKMGADSKRFIVSSEIYKGESTLLRTKSAFLDTFGQTDWTMDLTHKNSNPDFIPKEKFLSAFLLGISKIGITIIYNPAIKLSFQVVSQTIQEINEIVKINNQDLIVNLIIIDAEEQYNHDLLVLESIRQLQDYGLNPHYWIIDLNGDTHTASLVSSQAQIDDRLNTSVILNITDLDTIQKQLEVTASTIGIDGMIFAFNVWEKFFIELNNKIKPNNIEKIIGEKIITILDRLDHINATMDL